MAYVSFRTTVCVRITIAEMMRLFDNGGLRLRSVDISVDNKFGPWQSLRKFDLYKIGP